MKIVRYYTNLTSGAVLQRSGHRNLLVLSWSPWQANNWNPSAWHKPDHVVVSAYSKTLAVLIQIYVNVITQSLSTYWFTPHQNEKALRELQTLHTGCSKAEPKNFHPAADPLPRGTGWPEFNQLEMVTTFTYKSSLVRIIIIIIIAS